MIRASGLQLLQCWINTLVVVVVVVAVAVAVVVFVVVVVVFVVIVVVVVCFHDLKLGLVESKQRLRLACARPSKESISKFGS